MLTYAERNPICRCALLRKTRHTNTYEVLLIKRPLTAKFLPGLWEVPGGNKEETDSSQEAAAIRETKEETGLSVTGLRLALVEKPYYQSDSYRYLYVSGKFESEIQLSDEHTEYRWVPVEAATHYPLTGPTKRLLNFLQTKIVSSSVS